MWLSIRNWNRNFPINFYDNGMVGLFVAGYWWGTTVNDIYKLVEWIFISMPKNPWNFEWVFKLRILRKSNLAEFKNVDAKQPSNVNIKSAQNFLWRCQNQQIEFLSKNFLLLISIKVPSPQQHLSLSSQHKHFQPSLICKKIFSSLHLPLSLWCSVYYARKC